MGDEAIEIGGRRASTLVVSAVQANTGVLEKGQYDVSCDVACAIAIERTTPDTITVTLANGYPIAANNTIPVRVGHGQAIYAIAGGAGTLKYIRTGN
jgi:hypothetical protein